MKIVVLKENLKNSLESISGIIEPKTNLPILKNFLLCAEKNKIVISVTNLEIGVNYQINGKILDEGKLSVPLMFFLAVINNLNAEKFTLETKKNNLLIKTENYQAEIFGSKPEEFPIIPKITNFENYIELNTGNLKESFLKIKNSIQHSEIRPEISGSLFDISESNLTLVGTDSFRLGEKIIYSDQVKNILKEPVSVIIPLKTIEEVLKIFKNDQENLRIYLEANQVLFKTERQEIISRLINGNFPEYKNIIPKEFKTEILINKEELINGLKITGLFTSQVNEVKLKVGDNLKYLELYSGEGGLGENQYLIPAKIKGEIVNIVFNYRYLIDGLKVINEKEVFLGLNKENQPIMVKSLKETSFFYILMPIKY